MATYQHVLPGMQAEAARAFAGLREPLPGVTENAPWDVRAFGEKDVEFPVHPTFEQLYTGERFEAYRVLGAHAASKAIAAMGTSALHTPRSNVHG